MRVEDDVLMLAGFKGSSRNSILAEVWSTFKTQVTIPATMFSVSGFLLATCSAPRLLEKDISKATWTINTCCACVRNSAHSKGWCVEMIKDVVSLLIKQYFSHRAGNSVTTLHQFLDKKKWPQGNTSFRALFPATLLVGMPLIF